MKTLKNGDIDLIFNLLEDKNYKELSKLVKKGVIKLDVKEYVELSKADLEGSNLSGINLSGANLSWANLRNANLYGTELSYANLRNANLNGANLMYADLSFVNLNNANLNCANLNSISLMYADLSGIKLSIGMLKNAILTKTELIEARLEYDISKKTIEESIEHWEDIVKKFDTCSVVKDGDYYRWSDGSRIEDSTYYCELCKVDKINCGKCPYFFYYGVTCDSGITSDLGHWYLWNKNRTLKTAEDMRDALKVMLI